MNPSGNSLSNFGLTKSVSSILGTCLFGCPLQTAQALKIYGVNPLWIYFWEPHPTKATFLWEAQTARVIKVSKTSSHVCARDRRALKHGGIINPSLWTPAYILAELSHPGTLQISISAHKAVLRKHWTVCNVGAGSWLTKPRGPEHPSLPLVRGFLRASGRDRESRWTVLSLKKGKKQGALPNSSGG